jgi:hypothetical protein
MERTKKSTRKKAAEAIDQKIVSAYRDHLLSEGKRPVSVYKFALDIGLPEDQFYNLFGSFDGLDKHVWNSLLEKTVSRLRNDDSYPTFSAREKILAFYFTLAEELKSQRSLIVYYLELTPRLELVPWFLKTFKITFDAYVHEVLETGKANGEIAKRPMLDKQYPRLFWIHLGFLLHFWKDDTSAGFENTDAAIEKSVNLAFDLIGKGAVDSVIDFGKFLYQTKKV